MENIGLVLSGGGGKGAYEIGVCKALRELNIEPQALAGTSIGAINGALYLQDNLSMAEDLWKNLNRSDLISPNLEVLSATALTAAIQPYLSTLVASRGIFNQDGIGNLLEKKTDLSKISNSTIPFFVAVHKSSENRISYLKANGSTEERTKNIILASASLPGLFPPIKIDGENYSDGGWHYLPGKKLDNTPITPLYGAGCKTIITVMLNRDDPLERDLYPGAVILPIVPSEDLGGVSDGLLDCSREGAKRRINLGYSDTMKILSRLSGQEKIREKSEEIFSRFSQNEIEIKKEDNNPREDIKNVIESFNRAIEKDSFKEDINIPSFTEEKVLSQSTRSLLRDIEKKELAIDVESFVDANRGNEKAISKALLEGISLLSPVESRSSCLGEQGFFKRFKSLFSGNNDKIIAESQKDLAMAQYAAFSMIEQIQRKNLLSLELTVAANTKINALFSQMDDIRGENRHQVMEIYKSMSGLFFKLRKEIMNDRNRIENLERRVNLIEWLDHVKVQSFGAVEYRNLPAQEAFICVINDFYRLTDGQWNLQDLMTLKESLLRLDLADRKFIPGKAFGDLNKETSAQITAGLYCTEKST